MYLTPELYIITGANGAGKSSIGPVYLPAYIRQVGVFDGDKLFMQKRSEFWQMGIKSHKECKRMALDFVEKTFDQLVENALEQRSHFAYEGHFTNLATWDIPKRFKASGYLINLTFLGLSGTDLSQLRVLDRAKEGGHYVDPATVSANFYGNLERLNEHFTIFDNVQIIDTSESMHKVLAIFSQGKPLFAVNSEDLPTWFLKGLPELSNRINSIQI